LVPGIQLVGIDELDSSLDENFEKRQAAVPQLESLIENEAESFMSWYHSRQISPVIADLRRKMEQVAGAELEMALRGMEPAAAGDHCAPFRIGVDGDDLHFVPIGLQLVGYNPAQRGTHMLTHLSTNDIDRHGAAGVDAIPDGWLEEFAGAVSRLGGEARSSVSQHDPGAHHRNQEAAARRLVARSKSVSRQANHESLPLAFWRPRA
jgi:hypothetical protein